MSWASVAGPRHRSQLDSLSAALRRSALFPFIGSASLFVAVSSFRPSALLQLETLQMACATASSQDCLPLDPYHAENGESYSIGEVRLHPRHTSAGLRYAHLVQTDPARDTSDAAILPDSTTHSTSCDSSSYPSAHLRSAHTPYRRITSGTRQTSRRVHCRSERQRQERLRLYHRRQKGFGSPCEDH